MTFDKEKWRAELEAVEFRVLNSVFATSTSPSVWTKDALALLERAYDEGRADTLRSEMDAHDIGDEDREAWRTGTEFFDNEDLTTYRCENYDRIAALLAVAQGGIK